MNSLPARFWESINIFVAMLSFCTFIITGRYLILVWWLNGKRFRHLHREAAVCVLSLIALGTSILRGWTGFVRYLEDTGSRYLRFARTYPELVPLIGVVILTVAFLWGIRTISPSAHKDSFWITSLIGSLIVTAIFQVWR